MDKYEETHNTWNNLSQLYEDKFMNLDLYNDTYLRFCELLSKSNASILEIGCGPGNITQRILETYPDLKILATDISENMLHLAQKNNPSVETRILDARDMSMIKNQYDGILCGFTIPYLSKEDCVKFFSDCSQLLNRKGVFYFSFVTGEYKESGFITGSTGDRAYFYYHEKAFITTNLILNGVEVIENIEKEYQKTETLSEIHTIIIARKF